MLNSVEKSYVFVDTSMYESNNFHFHQYVMGKFKDLCKERFFYLLMSPIVDREVKCHLIEKSADAFHQLGALRKSAMILRNLPELDHHVIFKDISSDAIENLLLKKFEVFKKEAVFHDVDLSLASTQSVIDRYFNLEPPFSNKKKSEFPDAIILESLLTWAKNKEVSVFVLSKDGDMKNFCDGSDGMLIYIDSMEYFVDLAVKSQASSKNIKFAEDQVESKIDEIKEKIEDFLQLYDYTSSSLDYDDEISDIEVYDIVVLKKSIVEVDESKAVFSFSIKFNVNANHSFTDMDRSVWDAEDKVYMFTASNSAHVKHDVYTKIYINMRFDQDSGDSKLVDISIDIEDSFIGLDMDEGEIIDLKKYGLFDDDYHL